MSRVKLRNMFAAFAVALVVFPASVWAIAPAVPGDYDGDGKTDIVVARSILGGWYWFTRYATGEEGTIFQFGLTSAAVTPDQVYAGDFDGDGKFEAGVVRTENGGLDWYARQPNGSAVKVQWGLASDTPITGLFDSDNTTDKGVVRNMLGGLFWYLKRSSDSDVIDSQWGLSGDTPFVGDIDGDGIDDLIVARGEAGGYNWYVRTVGGSLVSIIQWGLTGDTLVPPYDVNGDGYDDLIVVRANNGFLEAYIRRGGAGGSASATQVIRFGLAGDLPFVGSFDSIASGQFSVYREVPGNLSQFFISSNGEQHNQALIQVPFGLPDDVLVRPDGKGVAITEVAAEAPAAGSGLSSVCSTIIPFSSGSLWKPSSDHTNDARENRPVMLYNRSIPSGIPCLNVYASNGEVVSKMGVYEYNGRYGGRWYTGRGCGDLKYGSQIASAAQSKTGSPRVYVQRQQGVCVGPFDPRNRNGGLA